MINRDLFCQLWEIELLHLLHLLLQLSERVLLSSVAKELSTAARHEGELLDRVEESANPWLIYSQRGKRGGA